MKLKNVLFFYSSFRKKSGRIELLLYFIFNFIANYFALELYRKTNLNDEQILNIFYSCLIILLSFVPTLAAISRRLRDLNANPTFVIFSFIPILNIPFFAFLLLVKGK